MPGLGHSLSVKADHRNGRDVKRWPSPGGAGGAHSGCVWAAAELPQHLPELLRKVTRKHKGRWEDGGYQGSWRGTWSSPAVGRGRGPAGGLWDHGTTIRPGCAQGRRTRPQSDPQ